MFIAYVFVNLRASGCSSCPGPSSRTDLADRRHGHHRTLAILISLVYAAVLGLVLYVLVYRPLRNAAPLTRVCASVGVMLDLQAIAVLNFGTEPVATKPIFPSGAAEDLRRHVPADRLCFAGVDDCALGRAMADLPLHPLRARDPGGRRERTAAPR